MKQVCSIVFVFVVVLDIFKLICSGDIYIFKYSHNMGSVTSDIYHEAYILAQ